MKNLRRLACLRIVIERPGVTVGEVAQETELPLNQASINLRLLQSRGLITCARKSRWTHYAPDADPLVAHAGSVMDALAAELADSRADIYGIMAKLRAFTHARRLAILSVLSCRGQPLTTEALAALTHISLPAAWRHLRTLETAGIIRAVESGWGLLPERGRSPLVKTLLRVL